MALRTATSWHGTAGPRRSARGGEARGPRATLGRRGRPEPEATPAPAGPGRAAGAQLRVAGRVSMHDAGEELLGFGGRETENERRHKGRKNKSGLAGRRASVRSHL